MSHPAVDRLAHDLETHRTLQGPSADLLRADLAPDALLDADRLGDDGDVVDLDWYAPTLGSSYGLAALDADRGRELVSLARLPGWPGAPDASGHGWGAAQDDALGGGVRPGTLLALCGARPGVGTTSLALQLADGLALRCVELVHSGAPGPLTPVLLLTELPDAALTWRTLARWTGADAQLFRAGRSAARAALARGRDDTAHVARTWEAARLALTGALGAARNDFVRTLRVHQRGAALVETTVEMLRVWRRRLAEQHERDVCFALVIDPFERWSEASGDEALAHAVFVAALAEAARTHDWLVLGTSVAAAARGVVERTADAVLDLVPAADGSSAVDLVLTKNRWGAPTTLRYDFDAASGRFTPQALRAQGRKPPRERAAARVATRRRAASGRVALETAARSSRKAASRGRT